MHLEGKTCHGACTFTCDPPSIAQKADIIRAMQLYSAGYEGLPSSRRISEALVIMDGDISRRILEKSHSHDRTRYTNPLKMAGTSRERRKVRYEHTAESLPPDVGQVEKSCRAHGAARGFAADKHEPRWRPIHADE
jgi:hypothetical protein